MTLAAPQRPSQPPAAPEALLELSGLNVYYVESHILRDVDLTVKLGQMVCLIGRNGVGKTTLLKTVVGLLLQRRGQLAFDGREVSALPPHRRARAGIGYVP
ncbi:MAG: ATP-binding cassette domain-containing protein, partial [Cyanobium sp.]